VPHLVEITAQGLEALVHSREHVLSQTSDIRIEGIWTRDSLIM
jgi:hypothetical protein